MKLRSSVVAACAVALVIASPAAAVQGRQGSAPGDTVAALGLERGTIGFETDAFVLRLVRASQTVASLRPRAEPSLDFTPGDRLERRAANGYYQLGDLTLRLRPLSPAGPGEWTRYSTALHRRPVERIFVSVSDGPTVLAAADLGNTLPDDIPLGIRRYWQADGDRLILRFELRNRSSVPVEIGALGIPLVFNNILEGRSLDEAHAVASFHDPYIGRDAGYVQVIRLDGHGPALVVVPHGRTPLEAWNPLLDERTRRGVTFEGFHEWMPHSLAYAENEWSEAEPWNEPTSATLSPGESRSYGVELLVSPSLRAIETTLTGHGRPVAIGVPGYVLPADLEAKLFVNAGAPVDSIAVEPEGALSIAARATTPGGWEAYDVRGLRWGRARLTLHHGDGSIQTVHYRVIEPARDVANDLGRFLTTEQWYENPDDPFGRSPSIISYDYEARRQVTEDNRAWIAGLGDEGGSGSWLAAIVKQLISPDTAELRRIEAFASGVLWGGLQYATGERAYGVRKSMFWYEPDEMPAGTYADTVRYGGWSSWDREEAMSVVRSYNYPHVAAAWWVLYRLARNHAGLVADGTWDVYLDRAWRTGVAMVEHAPRYAQFGQMDGSVFLFILQDLRREGLTDAAATLEAVMRERAETWRSLGYPFGSEMPWDSTGQEEVYAWCRYFGFDEKAQVTLDAILAYMPTLPHWGYNGSARRYWDFQYAGKLRRVERQLHHYGSGLNAIPILMEYRDNPDDFHLLRVGYGGLLGSIANVTQDGFGPGAFHAWPSTLDIDGYSGDYGPGFYGHAVNTGTYVVRHPEFGWLAFGGNITVEGDAVRVRPLDSARSRVYLAPLGLWLTLDAGTFQEVVIADDEVRLTLSPVTTVTPAARLRIEQPARSAVTGVIAPAATYAVERGAYVVPLSPQTTSVILAASPGAAESPTALPSRAPGDPTAPGAAH